MGRINQRLEKTIKNQEYSDKYQRRNKEEKQQLHKDRVKEREIRWWKNYSETRRIK